MSMGKRNGLSRGDARRHDRAILAIDLADTKQVLALCDHDSRVLARRTVRGRAWQLEEALRWGRTAAVEHGFAGVVVGCEPTGHRWRIVAELCDRLELDLVCVQPLLVGRAREQEDLTRDKSDPKDAVLIGRLVAGLRCYLPERTDQVWARLRQLGGRRVQLIIQVGAARQQLRDLLECAWPAVLEAAAEPLDSRTWRAAVQVALAQLAEAEQRMTGVLDPLDLTSLVTTIPGLSAVGAAAILAETGELARFDSARALVKHAGLCPAPTSPAPLRAPPASPDEAAPPCGWPPGGRPGARWRTTRSWPPATPTSPAATTTSSPPPRPAPPSPRPCSDGCGSWSPPAPPGRPPSPPASSTPARR